VYDEEAVDEREGEGRSTTNSIAFDAIDVV
jgi:hypothetical protein